MSQHHNNANVDSFNSNSVVADERSEILAWLSPLRPQRRHRDIQACRVNGVGEWLLDTEEYRNWSGGMLEGKSDGSALFCHGAPGVGKTYISSLVIDRLCDQAVGGNAAVAWFYFDFAAQEEQSPVAILGSVLQQIVGGLDEVPERIVKAFRDRGKAIGGQRLALLETVEFLLDISSTRRTFICIDAIDECALGHRVKLLDLLNQILQKAPSARLFLTGRHHIRDEVDKHLVGRVAFISITPTRNDIVIFLRAKLKEDTTPDAMDQSLEEDIIQNIPDTASEMFLLASLSIETILLETTMYRRRQRLSAMKNGLDLGDAYAITLERIKAQGGGKARLGMAVLMWISHSRRPLRVDEICHAVATQIGSNGLNHDDIPSISTLLSCCQGLAAIGEGTSTIRLIHFTLQEYLSAHPNLFGRSHSTIAETCLTYLNFQHIRDLPTDPPPEHWRRSFLEYSSLYWGTHMREGVSDLATSLALKLLHQFDSHVSANILWSSISRESTIGHTPGRKPFSALHCISYFGIAEVADILIKLNKWDVNETDDAGMTPLIWAARCGHEGVGRVLLEEKHIQPNQQNTNDGRTALSWAAGNGREGVVRLLLGPQSVNPGSIGRRWGGAPRVAGLLFGRRSINPNIPDKSGRTPLMWAVVNGHEGVARLLLVRKDVHPNISETEHGLTPLLFAAKNGHEGIVELLLRQRSLNPNISDRNRQTPLMLARQNGHDRIVELLQAKGIR